ncbi:M23 family metallopeptidase [Streptomyces sp. NPDC017979]|uniref:M23 family metallopeptidase n=1 Tax=Streptomyces sp. NPDC017979 TaxID=3365024 RepID=UPI0037BC2505
MASNSPAPEAPAGSSRTGAFSENGAERSYGEWNPSAETVGSSRGRHRVLRQQRRAFARSSTVLGVGVIAAVGAGGIATAQNKPPVSISLPDGLGGGDDKNDDPSGDDQSTEGASELMAMGATAEGGAGEALRSRILQQAEQQQAQAEAAKQAAADKAAKEKAEKEAQAKAKAKAEAEKKKAEAEAKAKAEAERKAKLAKMFALPLSSYSISATYGQSGSMWSSGQHTGLDFVASSGTPLKAVGAGTVKSAGWSGPAYGYQVILELNDGTEIMYAHMSSVSVGAGQKVVAGDGVGRVGATGNVSGAHLHMEVKTPGGATINPASWLQSKGLSV